MNFIKQSVNIFFIKLLNYCFRFETNEAERACMSACKDDSECHGQSLVEGPTECIQECRDQCVATRKTQIKQRKYIPS